MSSGLSSLSAQSKMSGQQPYGGRLGSAETLERMGPDPQSVGESFVGVSAKKLQEVGIKFPGRRDSIEQYGMGVGGMGEQVRGNEH